MVAGLSILFQLKLTPYNAGFDAQYYANNHEYSGSPLHELPSLLIFPLDRLTQIERLTAAEDLSALSF